MRVVRAGPGLFHSAVWLREKGGTVQLERAIDRAVVVEIVGGPVAFERRVSGTQHARVVMKLGDIILLARWRLWDWDGRRRDIGVRSGGYIGRRGYCVVPLWVPHVRVP